MVSSFNDRLSNLMNRLPFTSSQTGMNTSMLDITKGSMTKKLSLSSHYSSFKIVQEKRLTLINIYITQYKKLKIVRNLTKILLSYLQL